MSSLHFRPASPAAANPSRRQSRLPLPRMRVHLQSHPTASPIPSRTAASALAAGLAHRSGSIGYTRVKGVNAPDNLPGPAASGGEEGRTDGGGPSIISPAISPTDFAHSVLRVDLWSKQREVLSALLEHRRVAVKAGNGLGKGFSAAVAVLWFLHTHDPAIVLSTAPTFRQVRYILWRQIHVLHRRAPDVLKGKLLDTRWELAEDRYALGLSADTADQFQGFHCPNVFIVVDEAEGVSDSIYEAIEAVMTSDGSRLLLIGNPTTVSGVFRRAFHEERSIYHCITISAMDSPNVRQGRITIPGLTTPGWVEERRQIWGEENPLYRARVLGEFPDQAPDTLVPLSAVEAAARRWEATDPDDVITSPGADSQISYPAPVEIIEREVVLAVDVARFGSDNSVILRRRGLRIEEILTFNGMDTMQLVGWIVAAIREFQPLQTCIDEVGVGGGVVDRLREQGYGVRGFNGAHAPRQRNIFANMRAEGYWRLRDLFAAGEIAIPPDQQLIGELASIRYGHDSKGHIKIDSKDEMRKRGIPSPDKADALMLAFVTPPSRPRIWT